LRDNGIYAILFLHMTKVTVQVNKNTNESNMNLIRRFSRKVQETGMIQKVKGKRYNERPLSKLAIKNGRLKYIAKKKVQEKLYKLGKSTKIKK
jgi:ribosomal protein S21